jgi:hypothetical protein
MRRSPLIPAPFRPREPERCSAKPPGAALVGASRARSTLLIRTKRTNDRRPTAGLVPYFYWFVSIPHQRPRGFRDYEPLAVSAETVRKAKVRHGLWFGNHIVAISGQLVALEFP